MKAGTALGLLAGLGALNAMRGGRDGTGPRFTGLMDMLDGGGAGQSGDKFEGGGLLSMLGNLFLKPMQAQQRVEEIAARTSARDRDSSPRPMLRPTMTTGTPITEYSDSLLAPVIPVTSDPRNFQQGTEPSMLTEDQKEAIVMSQDIPPSVFDPRNFQQGTEPSTLTENQRMRAAGILAGQTAMEPVTQSQLNAGAESEAPNAYGFSVMSGYGDKSPDAPVAPDPMGLLSPTIPPQNNLPELVAPQSPALDESLQRITGGVSFRQKAEEQLSSQIDGLYNMPAPERERLIAERAALLKQTYDQMMRDQIIGLGM